MAKSVREDKAEVYANEEKLAHAYKWTPVEHFIQKLAFITAANGSLKFSNVIALEDAALEYEEEHALNIFKAGQDSTEEGGKSFDQWYKGTYGKK